jgi:hypothetical protein
MIKTTATMQIPKGTKMPTTIAVVFDDEAFLTRVTPLGSGMVVSIGWAELVVEAMEVEELVVEVMNVEEPAVELVEGVISQTFLKVSQRA